MSNASQIKATGTFSTHLLFHHHRLDTPNSKRNYVQHHKQQCYFQLVLWITLTFKRHYCGGGGGTILKLYNWSAKIHLKSVGMFGCQVRKERREGGQRKSEREKVQGRKRGQNENCDFYIL